MVKPHSPHRVKASDYEPVATVPDGLRWKPAVGWPPAGKTVLLSFGNAYRLERTLATGEVQYFKLKDVPEKSPSEKIDAEPVKPSQVRYNTGKLCWLIDTGGRWFLCKVVERTPGRIVLRSETGWDADKQAPWTYGELLEFPAVLTNPLFARLRPLKARYR